MKGCVLILGATSAIARGIAAAFARRGHSLYLAGRDAAELARDAANLRVRYGVEVRHAAFDALRPETHAAFVAELRAAVGVPAGVVVAFGYLGTQAAASRDCDETARILAVNFTGAVSILDRLALEMETRGSGFIVGLASVAGDRGRQSNYTYGAAKGGFALYLQGLRNRLFPAGVRVLTVKPGFVDTAMTFGMPGLFLVADPMQVGERICRGVEQGRDVLYVPAFWRLIMTIIRSIPETVFKRLKL